VAKYQCIKLRGSWIDEHFSSNWYRRFSRSRYALGAVCRDGRSSNWVRRALAGDAHRIEPFRSAALVVRLTAALIALHGLLILFWASCYRLLCFASWGSAIYFSASSYATVGYGDVVLPLNWRMLGPLESIVGVLMCGISVSLVFAMTTRLVGRETQFPEQR
jgi:hypothetical protein